MDWSWTKAKRPRKPATHLSGGRLIVENLFIYSDISIVCSPFALLRILSNISFFNVFTNEQSPTVSQIPSQLRDNWNEEKIERFERIYTIY